MVSQIRLYVLISSLPDESKYSLCSFRDTLLEETYISPWRTDTTFPDFMFINLLSDPELANRFAETRQVIKIAGRTLIKLYKTALNVSIFELGCRAERKK